MIPLGNFSNWHVPYECTWFTCRTLEDRSPAEFLSAQHHNRALQNGLLIIPVSPKFSNKYWSWNFIPHKAFWRYSRLAVSERYGRRKFFERRADGASVTAKNVTVSALQSAPIFHLHQTHHFELITKAAK